MMLHLSSFRNLIDNNLVSQIAILSLTLLSLMACSTDKPAPTPVGPVEVISPAKKDVKESVSIKGHSRGDYLQRTEAARAPYRSQITGRSSQPTHPKGLGPKVYQGALADMPEDLLDRADLILIPTPNSEVVQVYEPYDDLPRPSR